jgi:hypothetical protein
MMKKKRIVFLLFIALMITGCGGENSLEGTNMVGFDYPAGFFWGIWDGLTTPFSFIGKMFGAEVNIYEVSNSGNWYNFGFLLGSSGWGIFAGSSSK